MFVNISPSGIARISEHPKEIEQNPCTPGSAVVVGVGPGLGEALAVGLAKKGLPLALVSRSAPALESLTSRLHALNPRVAAFPCDATDERSFVRVMREIVARLGVPELVIYAAQGFSPGSLLTTEVAAFEQSWRTNCLGAFIVAREAARRMQPLGRGTILFVRCKRRAIDARKGYVNLAVGKFGLRALSQVIARELGPEGIHVSCTWSAIATSLTTSLATNRRLGPKTSPSCFGGCTSNPRVVGHRSLMCTANERFWEHC